MEYAEQMPADLVDLVALEAQSRRADEQFRERLDAAKASGESLFPPAGVSSDDPT